jgi:uncharacterized protein (DUF362 family)
MPPMSRRDFIRTSAFGLAATAAGELGFPAPASARVALVRLGAGGRAEAIRRAVDLFGAPDLRGKRVSIKPNFNSAHAYPGSTHNDTLLTLAQLSSEWGAEWITVADRSGMGSTRQVMDEKGVFELGEAHEFDVLPLPELAADHWSHIRHPDLHWQDGFYFARVFQETDALIQTCCLKTHRFGGHFTLSLKNTVGMVAKTVPGVDHDFMRELHGSRHQRRMIAEMNLAYEPTLVVMDAVKCFTSRGPEAGPTAEPNLILAATDRVALDAVGVAILRDHGTTPEVSAGAVFEQEQIARAAALGVGVGEPEQIEIVTADLESGRYADRLMEILRA